MRSRLAERSIEQPEGSSGEPLSAGETLLAGETLFESIGGRQCLERVHGRLNEKLFAHPVLGAFFAGKDRTHQENQQTDFMSAEFGGPRRYGGRTIDGAHQHMFITEALFELRHAILAATLDECGIEPALRNRWLALDHGFKNRIVKKTLEACRKRYVTDQIIVAPGTE